MEKSANRVNVEYQLLAPPAEPADSVPPASVLLATPVIGRPSSGAFISSSGELRAVSSPGLRQQAPAAMSAKPRSGYRILLPQVQQLLVSRLQPVVPGSSTSPETPPSPPVMSTAQVQFAASAATSSVVSSSDLVSRTQAFSFSSLFFPSAPAAADRMTGVMRAQLLSPSDSSASSNTSFFSCNLTNSTVTTAASVHQPAATVVHVCNPLSTSASQVNGGPPPTALRPPQMVLRYHSFPSSQFTSARQALALAISSFSDLAVVTTSQTSLQVAHTVTTTTTSPRPADRLPALQLMPVPGLQIPAAAVSGAAQHRLILSTADSLTPRLPSPSSQDHHHQPVILQRLSLAPVTGGTRPRQAAAAANISVRSSFPAARDPGAVVGGGVKTVMRTTLVPRSQAASYSDAQINSILQQMVPEPPCSDSRLNAEYDEGSRAAAIAANAEARLQLPLCPPLPSRQQSQEAAAAAADPELPPSAPLSCPATPTTVSYNAQTSPVIQPLEILQNPFLEPLVMEGGDDEESLENVVIPVIPEHLGELRLPTEKVIKDFVEKA